MVDGIQELITALQTDTGEPSKTYSAEISSIDNEGTVWVYLAGSNRETPTALSSAEVEVGDCVNVEWRNNKLYIAGNVSNPSVGSIRVTAVEQAAQIANQAAQNAVTDAGIARQAAEQAQAAVVEIEGDIDSLSGRVDTAEATVTAMETTVSGLNTRVTTAEGNITSIEGRVTTAEGDITAVEGSVSSLNTRVGTAEGKVTTLEGEVSTLDTNVGNLATRVTTAEGNISDVESDITDLTGRVSTAEGNITSIGSRVTTAEGNITTIEGNITSLGSRVTTAEGDITTVEGNISTLQTRVTTAEGNITLIEEKAQDASDAADTAQTAAEQAQATANAVEGIATRAEGYATDAQASANDASNSATLAHNKLSYVEDIVGVLDLVAKNGDYQLTSDTEIQENKWYFERVSGSGTIQDPYVYKIIDVPVVEDISTYYELVGIDTAIQNYVSSHLVLTSTGLSLQTDKSDYRLDITPEGMTIVGADGLPIAIYGTNAVVGSPTGFHIVIDATNEEIGFYTGDTKMAYMNASELYVVNNLSFGHFVFTERANGHFTLKLID